MSLSCLKIERFYNWFVVGHGKYLGLTISRCGLHIVAQNLADSVVAELLEFIKIRVKRKSSL